MNEENRKVPKRIAQAVLNSDEFSYAKTEAVSDEADGNFVEFSV